MIVVEGGDNVGKTTLVQQLIDESTEPLFRMHRQRFSPSTGGSIGQSYLDMLIPGNQAQPVQFGIADRLLASEEIYGNLFRGASRLTQREHFLIRASLLSIGTLVIFCDPPDDAILQSWREREQLYSHDPLRIAHSYRRSMEHIFTPLIVYRYDWTRKDAGLRRQALLQHHRNIMKLYESNHLALNPPQETIHAAESL